jgi:hypothetical protein
MSINYFRRDRTTALTSIEKLLVFIKDLHNKYPDIGFGNAATEIYLNISRSSRSLKIRVSRLQKTMQRITLKGLNDRS